LNLNSAPTVLSGYPGHDLEIIGGK